MGTYPGLKPRNARGKIRKRKGKVVVDVLFPDDLVHVEGSTREALTLCNIADDNPGTVVDIGINDQGDNVLALCKRALRRNRGRSRSSGKSRA